MIDYQAQSQRWLKQAREDINTATILLQSDKFAEACFYAEQSAQKSLKGYLIGEKQVRIVIHAITELLKKATQYNAQFAQLMDKGKTLDKYYLTSRYPDALPDSSITPSEAYTKSEAEEALAIAQEIFNRCEKK